MKYAPCAVVIFLALVATSASAAQPEPSPTPYSMIEVGASTALLTKGRGTWQSQYLLLTHHTAAHRVLYAQTSNIQRFGFTDPQYLAGFYLPMSTNTVVNIEGSFSPTHQVLPQSDFFGSLDHRLARGWGYTLGARLRRYPGLSVDMQTLMIDRYWGHYRVGYTLSGTQLSNVAGTSFSHATSLTRFYGANDASTLALSLNAGREAENIGTGVLISNVIGATLSGVQWSRRQFGFVRSISTLRQGSIYTRTRVQLGLRHRL